MFLRHFVSQINRIFLFPVRGEKKKKSFRSQSHLNVSEHILIFDKDNQSNDNMQFLNDFNTLGGKKWSKPISPSVKD